MDEFKKHIREHLSELDVDAPSLKVWQGIQKEVLPTKVFNIKPLLGFVAAACIIFIIGCGVWMFLSTNKSEQIAALNSTKSLPTILSQNDTVDNITKAIDGSKNLVKNIVKKQSQTHLNRNKNTVVTSTTNKIQITNWKLLESVENSFKQVIHLQKARINTTPLNAENPSYFKDFSIQFQQMENDETQIKREMKQNGFSNELLDQLINIYQYKLNLLKQLQSEINKTNNRYKQNRTPVDTTKTYFLNI